MSDEPKRPQVLVLDDSPLALAMVKAALEDEGMSVSCALDLAAFEASRQSTPPDVILVDVQMPEVFGDDLAGMLRGSYQVRAPIILVSSLDDDDLERRATEAKVDGFVSKRAGMPALVARVRSALQTGQG